MELDRQQSLGGRHLHDMYEIALDDLQLLGDLLGTVLPPQEGTAG